MTKIENGRFNEPPKNKLGPSVITINHLTVFKGSELILNDINFSLRRGEHAALIGPNGIGKTTLLNILTGTDQQDSGKVIVMNGLTSSVVPQEITAVLKPDSSQTVADYFLAHTNNLGQIKQQIESMLITFLKKTPSMEELNKLSSLQTEFENRGGYQIETRASEAMSGLGLSASVSLDRKLTTLSGGERTKLFLAQALIMPADILILDEPTNHLNDEAIKWLAGYLRTYPRAVLAVSHEPNFLDLFVHKIIALSPITRSAVEFQGNYSAYLRQKTEMEAAEKKKNDKAKKETARQLEVISRLKGGSRSAQAKSREKILNRQKDGFIPLEIRVNREIRIQFEIKRPSGIDVVKVSGLVKKYGQKILDYRSLELTLKKGDRLGIIGPIGAGKSTFVKTIVGEVKPDGGYIKLGNNVDIGYYSQTINGLNPKNTVLQEINSCLQGNLPESRVRAYLGRFLFTRDSVFKKVEVLSQGEKSRLALLKLVLGKNNFLILDEPTNHLDIQTKQMVAQALAEFQGTILAVSHDAEFLKQARIERTIIFPLKKITN